MFNRLTYYKTCHFCHVKSVIYVIRCVIYDTYVYNDLKCPYSRILFTKILVLLCYMKKVYRIGDLKYIKYKKVEILNQKYWWRFWQHTRIFVKHIKKKGNNCYFIVWKVYFMDPDYCLSLFNLIWSCNFPKVENYSNVDYIT